MALAEFLSTDLSATMDCEDCQNLQPDWIEAMSVVQPEAGVVRHGFGCARVIIGLKEFWPKFKGI